MCRRANVGFTLLEVVIAIFVLSAAATIFFAFLPTALKTGKMVGNHQQASSLVQHKIDQLRGVGYGRLNYVELRDAGIIDSSAVTSPYKFKEVDGLSSIYVTPDATIAITDFDAQTRKVVVTLKWTGSHYRQGNGEIQATALITKA